MEEITIDWSKKDSYDDASDSFECIYLFVAKGQPSYAGICFKSVFGGAKRTVGGRERGPRYGSSYSHLINAFLGNDGELYVGKCIGLKPENIKSVESSLINFKKPEQNKQVLKPKYKLKHSGQVPEYLKC